jgi:toxin-antitoxin system PIN domain toxin
MPSGMDALADVSVLLSLLDERHKAHSKVSAWFDDLPEGSRLLVCRVAQLGLIRLITSDSVMQGEALTLREAWAFYGVFLRDPSVSFVDEPAELQARWFQFCLPFGKATKRVTDAYFAGFAVAGKYALATLDKGFQDFEGLDLVLLK